MMDTEDDIIFEEKLLKMEDKREINSDHNPQDKEKCDEPTKQDKQPARGADRENPRKRLHEEIPTVPAEERIKKSSKGNRKPKKTFR